MHEGIFSGKSHGDAILLPPCTGCSPLRMQLLTCYICGKSGAEADVVVGVGARVVEVHVEDTGVATVVPVPAAVRHPLISRSRLSFLTFISISSFQHTANLLADFAYHARQDIVLLWSDISQIVSQSYIFLQYIYGHIQFT